MRAKKRCHAAAVGFGVLLTAATASLAQAPAAAPAKSLEEVIAAKPTAEFDAKWGSPDHMLFLPVIYAELAGRN